MARGNRPARCITCPRFGAIAGRGMCGSCYHRARVNDTLIDHDRRALTSAERVEEWHELKREGYSLTQAAERLGVNRKTLEKAIERYGKKLSEAA